MNDPTSSPGPLWDAIGWTMLHFLWIGAAIGLAAAVLRGMVRKKSPQTRYAVSLAAFAVLVSTPGGLFVRQLGRPAAGNVLALSDRVPDHGPNVPGKPARRSDRKEKETKDVARRHETATSTLPADPNRAAFRGSPDRVGGQGADDPSTPSSNIWRDPLRPLLDRLDFPYETAPRFLPWVWIAGCPLTSLWLLVGITGGERLRRRCRVQRDGELVVLCRRLQQVLHVRGTVALGLSDRIAVPILVGFVRPLILLPIAALTEWSPAQIEMVLLHELAHVRRRDNLVNLVQRLAEAVLFFHPAVWWLSGRVRLEREHCCDAVVLAHIDSPQAYAETLVRIAFPDFTAQWAFGASATGQLATRIRHILKQEHQPMQVSRAFVAVLFAAFLGLIGVAALWAQYDLLPRGIASKPMRPPLDIEQRIMRTSPKGRDVAVQVAGTRSGVGGMTFGQPGQPVVPRQLLRFEGKTFDVWRAQAQTELKPESRAEAIRAFGRFGSHSGYSADSIAAIVESLKSDRLAANDEGDQKVKDAARWSFQRIGAPSVPALILLLKDENPEIRRLAVDSLGDFLPHDQAVYRQVFDALAQATHDKAFWVRKDALDILKQVVFQREEPDRNEADKLTLVQVAIDRLTDDHPEMRREAASALGKFGAGASRATPKLVEALTDPFNRSKDRIGWGVLPAVAGALGAIRSQPQLVVPALSDLLCNSAENVQIVNAAAMALGDFGPDAATAVLALSEAFARTEASTFEAGKPHESRDQSRFSQQRAIAIALGKIGPKARSAAPLLQKSLAAHEKEQPRTSWAEALHEALRQILEPQSK